MMSPQATVLTRTDNILPCLDSAPDVTPWGAALHYPSFPCAPPLWAVTSLQ